MHNRSRTPGRVTQERLRVPPGVLHVLASSLPVPWMRACNLSKGNSRRTNHHRYRRERSDRHSGRRLPLESCINPWNTFVTFLWYQQLPAEAYCDSFNRSPGTDRVRSTSTSSSEASSFCPFINRAFVQCGTRSLYYSVCTQPISARCCRS